MKVKIISLLTLLCLTFAGQALAENSKAIGQYVVHYNALSTESLPPSVARAYSIKRSKNKALLNISVLKKGGSFEGVEADIQARATNLTGQLREIRLRKITEQKAVYYIGEFNVTDRETLDFDIRVTVPDGSKGQIQFREQFFTN